MHQRLSRVRGHESDKAFFFCFTRNFDPQFYNYTYHLEHSATLFSEMDLQSPYCFLRVDFFLRSNHFMYPLEMSLLVRAPGGLQAMLKKGGMGPAPSKPVKVLVGWSGESSTTFTICVQDSLALVFRCCCIRPASSLAWKSWSIWCTRWEIRLLHRNAHLNRGYDGFHFFSPRKACRHL